jgi:chemotaxis family two-component system response regulator Rcp1
VDRRYRILIAEDNKADVFLMREAIERAGIPADIEVVRDGHDATRYFEAVDADENIPCPDLILLDMNLPKRSGDEVLKHLRTGTRCNKTSSVLIISSSDAPQERSVVEAYGVSGYFRKPSNFAEFMKLGPVIEALLRKGTDPSQVF